VIQKLLYWQYRNDDYWFQNRLPHGHIHGCLGKRIDPELYEAASIDGASWLQKFLNPYYPRSFRPEMFVVILTTTIFALKKPNWPGFRHDTGRPGNATMVALILFLQEFFSELQCGLRRNDVNRLDFHNHHNHHRLGQGPKHSKNSRRSADMVINRYRVAHGVGKYVSLILLTALVLVMIFPLIMITNHFSKSESDTMPMVHWPSPRPSISPCWPIPGKARIIHALLMNSMVISLSAAFIAVGVVCFDAYALGIGKIKGRALILLFFMMAMTLPAESLIYPAYYFFKAVKLYDNLLSVILLEAALSASFGTYLLYSVFRSFDKDIIESAMIDGCSKLQILLRILIPLNLLPLPCSGVFSLLVPGMTSLSP